MKEINSVERVEATLNFSGPDRVPVWNYGANTDVFSLIMTPSKNWHPGHNEEENGLFPHTLDDMIIQSGLWEWEKPDWALNNPKFKKKKWLKVPREEIDEWGTIWNRLGEGTSIGHPGRANLEDWSKMDEFLSKYTPDPFDKSRYAPYLQIGEIQAKDKYRLCMLGNLGPCQTVQNLRGFTNSLIDHRKHPKELKYLLSYITENLIQRMDAWIKYGGKPHGFHLIEDLGTQKGPFVSPKMFRNFYKPVYETLIKAAHDRGCRLFHHCCGKINKILPDLIDWGLDALELDAPRMTGYVDLKPFRGKITLFGCVDIQTVYTQGTPEECEREVWHMMRNLGTKEGGFGAYFYSQAIHIRVPSANIHSFASGLEKYGTYSKIPAHWWDYPTIKDWGSGIVPPVPPLET